MVDFRHIKLNIAKEDRLAKYDESDKVISSHDYLKKLEEEKKRHGFKTGIPKLDALTQGFETGELVVISGYTGHGKTSFAQSLTVNLAKQDIKALWFSFEMPARLFFAKFPGKVPLFYLPSELKGNALSWVEDRILEAKVKYEIKAVFIDHLHFVVDLATRHPSLEIGTVVRTLKNIAMRQNLVVFLIAHTSMPKRDKSPSLGDIRDSSFITQESDATFVIERILPRNQRYYGNEAWLTILKHRRMGTIGRKIKLLYKDNLFQEIDEREIQ